MSETDQKPDSLPENHPLFATITKYDKVREEVKSEVEAYLNGYLKKQIASSLDDRKGVRDVVSAILNRFGLAIEINGKPCRLYATLGTRQSNGRFMLNPIGSGRTAKSATNIEDLLPLKLVYSDTLQTLEQTNLPGSPNYWQNLLRNRAANAKGTGEDLPPM